jgi:hypothetical protein
MNATLAPDAIDTSAREQYRGTAKSLRSNAGIDSEDRIEAVADFGAAARRLRESVRVGDDGASARRHVSASRRAQSLPVEAPSVAQDDIVVIVDEPVAPAVIPAKRKNRESVVLRMVRNRTQR